MQVMCKVRSCHIDKGLYILKKGMCMLCKETCAYPSCASPSPRLPESPLQRTATHCNTLRHAITHRKIPQHTATQLGKLAPKPHGAATHCGRRVGRRRRLFTKPSIRTPPSGGRPRIVVACNSFAAQFSQVSYFVKWQRYNDCRMTIHIPTSQTTIIML